MEIDNNFVFQTDSDIIKKAYAEMPGYSIKNTEPAQPEGEKYCALYFSSHDIYYPNDEQTFVKNIVEKNRFEWFGTRIKYASKHIFLRDLQKQWYLKGINSEINSIEKIYEFLKEETKGYKIIAIGSSAGGYAAVLFGSMLKAEKIFSFNGQMELSSLLNSSTADIDPTIFREKDNPLLNKYYSVRDYISTDNSVNYFCSVKSTWDNLQYQHIKDLNVNIYLFNAGHHGIPFLKTSLNKLLHLNKAALNKLKSKTVYNPLIFSYRIEGTEAFFNAVKIIWKKVTKSK